MSQKEICIIQHFLVVGVCHGDNTMMFLIMGKMMKPEHFTREDSKISALLMDLTTSFMKAG